MMERFIIIDKNKTVWNEGDSVKTNNIEQVYTTKNLANCVCKRLNKLEEKYKVVMLD